MSTHACICNPNPTILPRPRSTSIIGENISRLYISIRLRLRSSPTNFGPYHIRGGIIFRGDTRYYFEGVQRGLTYLSDILSTQNNFTIWVRVIGSECRPNRELGTLTLY